MLATAVMVMWQTCLTAVQQRRAFAAAHDTMVVSVARLDYVVSLVFFKVMEQLAIFLSCFMCRMDRADILLKLHAILRRAVSQTVGASLYPTNNVTRGISNDKNPFSNLQILVLSVSHILSV